VSETPAAEAQGAADAAHCRALFAASGFLATIGARLEVVEPGHVEMVLPLRPEVSQHNGFGHAGALTTVLDTASGFAARTLSGPGTEVLSVDFTVHLVRPAVGDHVRAVAQVVNAGRTTAFVRAEAHDVATDGSSRLCALMTATMATPASRPPDSRPPDSRPPDSRTPHSPETNSAPE